MINDKLKGFIAPIDPEAKNFVDTLSRYVPLYEDHENATLSSADMLQKKRAADTYRYSELKDKHIDGFPLCVKRDEAGELNVTFTENTHSLIVGATRSGKSTGFVIPFLNLMPLKKNKPSIVVSDPKGELYRGTHKTFEENGYRIIVLDFIDYQHSDSWNPLTKTFRKYQRSLAIEKEVKAIKQDGEYYHVLDGEIFRDEKELQDVLAEKRDAILTEVDNDIISLATMISPVTKDSDPYWEEMSATLIQGFLWALLEDSDPNADLNGRTLVTEDTYSFETIGTLFSAFNSTGSELDDHGFFINRPKTSKARRLVETSIIKLSANVTRSCIVSSFLNKMRPYRDACVSRITCTNTFSIPDIATDEKPTVIFVSYKDEDSLNYQVISMFFTDLYLGLIETARKVGGRLERPFYFLLDEFGNFPKFSSFENVISACGSRNLWFMLVVQSYAQLYRIYGEETAEIIIDNLNMHLYFGSNNYKTKEAFSKECGRHTVPSPQSALNGSSDQIENFQSDEVPLVPISRLSQLGIGEFYVTQMRGDTILSYSERSYLCPEYDQGDKATYRRSPVRFADKRYRYDLEWCYK